METPTADPRFHGSEVYILGTPTSDAARLRRQTWTALLPARIADFGCMDRASTASTEVSAIQKSSLETAAQSLHISLSDYLQAGFAALLARLTHQEAVDIVAPGKHPARLFFRCEDSSSVATLVRERTAKTLDVEAESFDLTQEVGWEFSSGAVSSPWLRDCCLGLSIRVETTRLRLTLSSAGGLWSTETLGRWLVYLRNLWLHAAATPAEPVWKVALVPESELAPVYRRLNDTATEFPDAPTVHDIFAEQARRTPHAIAAACEMKKYTYRELEERSARMAQELVRRGAGAGKPVAVCMKRSADLLVALLAILRSGSCYVPLNPTDPVRRLRTILGECRPIAVLSDAATASALPQDIPVLTVDNMRAEQGPAPPLPAVNPDSVAYIIYTSGTTGRPKGVMIAHRGLRNTLCALRNSMHFGAADRLLAVFTVSFDAATMELLMPLIAGGSVTVAGANVAGDPNQLQELLHKHDITMLSLTPVSWRMLLDSGWKGKANLKMVSGGEALSRELANRLLDRGAALWNSYGPTETSICCSHLRLTRGPEDVPIGPPIANSSFYVADAKGRPLPEDVPGELWIGGVGVGEGYLGNEDLTRDRFMRDPFRQGQRIYRSGDLVRLRGGKELQFLGRVDSQVKLRGFRIELGEIESVMRSHPSVRDAVVVLRKDANGDPALVAYATTDGRSVSESELRDYAAQFLAESHLPARIGILKEMPRTPSGKIDHSQLPAPEQRTRVAHGVQPANDLERKLLSIFHDVLGERSMGVTESFFDFGGYSLLIVRLFAYINRELELNLPISVIFEAPSVRGLADYIRQGEHPSIVVPIRPDGRGTPLFIVHSYLIYDALAKAVGCDTPLFGARERVEDGPAITFESRAEMYARAIAARYPRGPVHLAGWCAAASLTVEIARRLDAIYGRHGLVILIDGELPGFFDRISEHPSFWRKVWASLRYHRERFRSLPASQKADYLGDIFYHRWERLVARLSSKFPAATLWLHRRLPSAIPIALGNDDAVASVVATRKELQPYDGELLLLRASDELALPKFDKSLGWNTIATRGTRVIVVPGSHVSMFREPHLSALGQQFDLVFSAFESSRRALPKTGSN